MFCFSLKVFNYMNSATKAGKARDYYITVDNMNSSEEQIFFSSGHNPEDGMQLEDIHQSHPSRLISVCLLIDRLMYRGK